MSIRLSQILNGGPVFQSAITRTIDSDTILGTDTTQRIKTTAAGITLTLPGTGDAKIILLHNVGLETITLFDSAESITFNLYPQQAAMCIANGNNAWDFLDYQLEPLKYGRRMMLNAERSEVLGIKKMSETRCLFFGAPTDVPGNIFAAIIDIINGCKISIFKKWEVDRQSYLYPLSANSFLLINHNSINKKIVAKKITVDDDGSFTEDPEHVLYTFPSSLSFNKFIEVFLFNNTLIVEWKASDNKIYCIEINIDTFVAFSPRILPGRTYYDFIIINGSDVLFSYCYEDGRLVLLSDFQHEIKSFTALYNVVEPTTEPKPFLAKTDNLIFFQEYRTGVAKAAFITNDLELKIGTLSSSSIFFYNKKHFLFRGLGLSKSISYGLSKLKVHDDDRISFRQENTATGYTNIENLRSKGSLRLSDSIYLLFETILSNYAGLTVQAVKLDKE